MKKRLITLLPILLLASCSINLNSPTNDYVDPTINWSYSSPEEEAIVVTKEGVEISSIEVVDVPTNGIKIACWDEHDIKLKVMYSDNSTELFRVYEKHIPLEYRHYLGEVGHHTISLVVNASVVHFGFDITKNEEFHGYKCYFWDYRSGQAELLDEQIVGYYQSVTYQGAAFEDVTIDSDTEQVFIDWDYSLNYIHQEMNFKAQFRDVTKRYYGDSVDSVYNMLIDADKKDESTYRALSYLGRLHAVPINHGDTVYHEQGNTEEALSFTKLNPFGNKWSEMNSNIIKYGVNYNYAANYGTYLYNTTGAFGEAANVLDTFETYYSVESKQKLLDNGELVNTSINPSFSNCYTQAEAYINETKSIDSAMESGYYRISLTMSFDVYVSANFSKVTNERYSLSNAKYIFAPIVESKQVRLSFSESKEFDNPFDKPLNFSTETLYIIANGLPW